MPHEPIILDRDEWPQSFPLVQYNLNRNAQNIHDFRNEVNGQFLKAHEDVGRVEAATTTNSIRIAILETKAGLIGLIAGMIGGGVISWIMSRIH